MNHRHWIAPACALVGLLSFTGCHKEPNPASKETLPPAPVRLQKVESKTRIATEEVVGTVRARMRATIEAKVAGRIELMPVAAGQAVNKGALLAQLDVREIQARLDQAKAAYQQVEQDRKRFEALFQQKAITEQENDAVRTRARIAAANVSETETMLDYARVTAPFDGIVSRKLADVGDLASPGRPLLELEDPNSLRLEVDVPEALIDRIQIGAKLPMRGASSTTDLEGVISEVSPAADPNSRTFRAKLDLPSGSGWRLGQFGRVFVPVGEAPSARIPIAALVLRGQLEIVFVAVDQTAHLRLVKTGKRLGEEIEILSGLNPGEQVVVDGATHLADGQPLEVKP